MCIYKCVSFYRAHAADSDRCCAIERALRPAVSKSGKESNPSFAFLKVIRQFFQIRNLRILPPSSSFRPIIRRPKFPRGTRVLRTCSGRESGVEE